MVARAKKGIHPKWYEHSPVICDGKEVKVVSGTIPVYKGMSFESGGCSCS